MTKIYSALAAIAAVLCLTAFASPAAAIEYPWCAEYSGEDSGGGRNCGFVSWDQCMLTVRGMGGMCERNLFYSGAEAKPQQRKRKRHSSRQ